MKSITLIGMPGSGKSTIGRLLARRLKVRFIDLDELIHEKEKKSHSQILKENGEKELLKLEEIYTLGLDFSSLVFSPGGSIVYSPKAMEKIKKESKIIYLELPFSEIKNRLGRHAATRGIVRLTEKGLKGLFEERTPLYQSFAYHIINCNGLLDIEIVSKIVNLASLDYRNLS